MLIGILSGIIVCLLVERLCFFINSKSEYNDLAKEKEDFQDKYIKIEYRYKRLQIENIKKEIENNSKKEISTYCSYLKKRCFRDCVCFRKEDVDLNFNLEPYLQRALCKKTNSYIEYKK